MTNAHSGDNPAFDGGGENIVHPAKKTVPEREEDVLRYWADHDIFSKTLDRTREGVPFVFYDGPPFATGLPHYGHLLAGTIKDVIPRYQTMKGRYVRREWGWDCHGLPIENLIESELGLKHKQDIEAYGIGRFNEKARGSVLQYDTVWKTVVPRMGRWVDMEQSYRTMDANYTESIWWAFKTLYGKGLIAEGYKSMHICPRCETTLANSEVTLAYMDVKDLSVTAKFELEDERGTFVLAWTTTPWTLPGNVALAINPELEYVKAKIIDGERAGLYIVAKDRLGVLGDGVEVVMEMHGTELVGRSYIPVFDYYAKDTTLLNHANGWKIVAGDFVTADSGTGVVHIAPAFGEDDMELGKKANLPFVQHVGMDGTFRPEVTDFAGYSVKPKSADEKERLATDIAIIKYLQEKGTYFSKEKIEHSYPHCWRCDTPLLNYAAGSWFVSVTKLKDGLIQANKNIEWIPSSMRDGRFGKWLEGARDWAISRTRFWGAPLPVWRCEDCGNTKVIGSRSELAEEAVSSGNTYLIMRHGQAKSNATNIVSCTAEAPVHLTQLGQEQARKSANALAGEKIDIIVASPFTRTRETAEIVADVVGIAPEDIHIDERLGEYQSGFDGRPIEELRAFFSSTREKFTLAHEGGEDLMAMKRRVMEGLEDLEKTYTNKKILIVAHEYTAWMLFAGVQGLNADEASEYKDNTGDDFLLNAEVRPLPYVTIPHNENYEFDFHRPYIDAIELRCNCGEHSRMRRIPEVFDCWFESGSMPFAQFHYLGDDESREGKLFRANFPADFIAEGQDQTRGWFYNMHVLSLGLFGESAFRRVIVNGLILAEDGQKMSKKLKNYPDPMTLVDKYGADALRMYLIGSPAVRAEELRFVTTGVDEMFKKLILRTDNVSAFFALYANLEEDDVLGERPKGVHVLDSWILARLDECMFDVTRALDSAQLDRAVRPLIGFIDDFSTWYVRRSRERFKGEDLEDAILARKTTRYVLQTLATIMAPMMPFYAEDLYLRVGGKTALESVHLEKWPDVGSTTDDELLSQMRIARDIVEGALSLRASVALKVRQPLARLSYRLPVDCLPLTPEFHSIIADEVNVREVVAVLGDDTLVGSGEIQVGEIAGIALALDITLTPELQEEGMIRDLARHIQEQRKRAGLIPTDLIVLEVNTSMAGEVLLKKYEQDLCRVIGGSAIHFVDALADGVTVHIDELTFVLALHPVS